MAGGAGGNSRRGATEELADLGIDEVKVRSARYRALREASDLEDVVFRGK